MMINQKYYQDIKNFPKQFLSGAKLAPLLKLSGEFNQVIVCGMGGSSLYVELVNDFLASASEVKIRVEVVRGYKIPTYADEKTLFVVSSYSGGTEETLACLDEIQNQNLNYVVFTSGGKLLERTKNLGVPIYQIPTGIQPRLSTGYYLIGLLSLLENCGLITGKVKEVLEIAKQIDQNLDEEKAKALAEKLFEKVPIIYGTSINSSLARVAKIKFNENSKIQSFWNYFPELNHNEMVGFTNLVSKPHFLILESKFCLPQNKKRIEVFTQLIQEKSLPVTKVEMPGESVFSEILNTYYFIDHVAYYLAQKMGIDPEPVQMVEDFKKLILK